MANDNPNNRIGEEWYDEQMDEIFTIVGVNNGRVFECEYVGAEIKEYSISYFNDERAYRFRHASEQA